MQAKAIAQDPRQSHRGAQPFPSCAPLPEPSASTPDTVLLGAREVTEKLLAGHSQMSVAAEAKGALEYGIGTMLYRLEEKGVLTSHDQAYQKLLSDIPRLRNKDGVPIKATRQNVIEHLRKIGLVEDGLPVRALKPAGTTPSAAQVLEVTEEVTGISVREIISKRRSKDIVNARFITMWVLRTVSGTSFSVIGEHLGGKDHTSVINGVSQVDLRRKTDKGTLEQSDRIADDADLLGIRSSMDILLRQSRLRLV